MKSTFAKAFALFLLFSSTAVFADVGEMASYSSDAIELANVLKHCAAEVSILGKKGIANQITGATHEVKEGVDIYSIVFEAGGVAPSFQRYSAGTLKVSASVETPQPRHGRVDGPGSRVIYKCEMMSPVVYPRVSETIPDEEFKQ